MLTPDKPHSPRPRHTDRSHGDMWLRVVVLWAMFNLSDCLSGLASKTNTETTAIINVTYIAPSGQFFTESSESGKFATESPTEPEKGRLIYWVNKAGYSDGCSLDNYDSSTLPKDERYILLISRTNCSFADKVLNAQRLNATAAVVYNTDGDEVPAMDTGNDQMVAIMIGKTQGEKLAKLLLNGTNIMMYINVGTKTTYRYTVSQTSVLFVSISFIVLMVISLVWLIFYYIQRFRYNHARDRTQRRLGNIAKKAVTKIPQKTLRKGDKELQPEFDNCSVCLEAYKASDVLRLLPCNHEFHKGCIDQWLIDHRTCPMCKLNILKAMGYNPTGDLKDEQSTSTAGSNFTVAPASLAAAIAAAGMTGNDTEDESLYDDGRALAVGGVDVSDVVIIDDVIDFNDVHLVITEPQSPGPSHVHVAEVTYETLQDPNRNRLNNSSLCSSLSSEDSHTELHNSTSGDNRSYQSEEPTSQLIL